MKLEIVNVSKSFGSKEILHQICFEVNSSKAMGFLGRNGAGKTTTFRCLMDVFKQDSGVFLLDGKPFDPKKNAIGYLPEERGMYYKISVMDQLVYFGELRGAGRQASQQSASYWIDRFGLNEFKHKKLETLSKGNQQKIQIAQAFLNDPDILILDEPFSGLDPLNSQIFKEVIREFVEAGKLVIFSSHQMAYVEEMCDEITLIDQGNILLTGDLNSIKRTIGDNKIVIEADGLSTIQLQDVLKEFKTQPIKNGVIVDINKTINRPDLMKLCLDRKLDITRFELYEPSLQDIFVKEVGGQA